MSPRRTARHDDGTADPLVALARADPLSPFYDPGYARPLSSTPPDGWGEIDMALLEESARRRAGLSRSICCRPSGATGSWTPPTRPARPPTTSRSRCSPPWPVSAARAPSCGWGRAGTSRWCCGRCWSVRRRAASRRRWRRCASCWPRSMPKRDDDANARARHRGVAQRRRRRRHGQSARRRAVARRSADVAAHRRRARAMAAGLVGAGGVVRARQGPAPHRPLRREPAARLSAAPSGRPSGGGPGVRVALAVRLARSAPLTARSPTAGRRATTKRWPRCGGSRPSRARPTIRWSLASTSARFAPSMDSCRRCAPRFQRPRISRWPGWARDAAPWPGWRACWNCWRGRRWARPFRRGRSAPRTAERAVRLWSDYFRAARPRAVRSQRARRARAAGPPRRPLAAQPRSCRGVARAGAHRSAQPPRRCRRGRPGAVSPAGRRRAAAGPLHRAAARPAPQSLVGQSAAQHHALCRKYRECRKVVKDDSNAVSGLDPPLQRGVELGERPRRVVEHGAEGRHQQPAERLLVAQPAAASPVAR